MPIRLIPQGSCCRRPFAPVARFTLSPTTPGEDQEVVFDASSSIGSCVPNPTDPNNASKCTPTSGAITSYQWDFGNGHTGQWRSRPTTRFPTRGSFTVKLVVTNDRGLSSAVSQTVTVSGVANPTAAFELSPSGPGVNQQVFFDANASQASPGRTISRYDWNFGDGVFGAGVTESHRFARAGSFQVTLTVTDSAGKTGTVSKSLTVGDTIAPTAEFTVSPASHRRGPGGVLRRHGVDLHAGADDYPLRVELR